MPVEPYGREASIIGGLPQELPARLRTAIIEECSSQHVPLDDVVPAESSLVIVHPNVDHDRIRRVIGTLLPAEVGAPKDAAIQDGPVVEIPVRYDGADLGEVAQRSGLGIDDVIALHAGCTYVVRFCGFSPGFAYLGGLPARLHLPRRGSPRTRVPGGSVAIAAHYSAVYPSESPGGWHLLGSTDAPMWDLRRDVPMLLQPGDRVRFVPVSAR
jgi:KipI family sensor histidine kinase inhibitor